MPLTLKEVAHIAALARLELSAQEKARYRGQLEVILDYIAKLRKLDTGAIPPTSSALAAAMSLRADEPQPGLSRAALLQNAPQQEEGQFKIPPVFE